MSAARSAGAVVDSVAQESDHVTFATQDANDSLLVSGREAGEKSCLLCRLGQFGVGHFLDFVAQQHRVGEEADVAAHLAADQVVVAGKDLHGNAMLVKRFNCRCSGGFGRVEECDISLQHKIVFIIL